MDCLQIIELKIFTDFESVGHVVKLCFICKTDIDGKRL